MDPHGLTRRRAADRRARRRDHRDRVHARSATTTAGRAATATTPARCSSRRCASCAPTSTATSRSSTCRSHPAGTDFQQAVWAQLREIGYGDTASYGEIAKRLGKTNAASRAVGLANGSNPIPIVIPCHRVIGADGTLTGYAGGIERKQALLEIEQDALSDAAARLAMPDRSPR